MTRIETFSRWIPFEPLGKARANPNGGDGEPMVGRIGGIISAEHVDQQGEVLVQDGIDWSYFINKGWFNYEHKAGPDNVLGHPEKVYKTTLKGVPATAVEGVLYLHKAKARETYETAVAMQKAGGARQIGFSVEGSVVMRNSRNHKQIDKSKVLNVAVTAHPVYPDARLEVLARSLAASGDIGYQAPAIPANQGFSVLAPQSLGETPSVATYGAALVGARKISVTELAAMLRERFPMLGARRARETAKTLIEAASR